MIARIQGWIGRFRNVQLLAMLSLLIVAHPFVEGGGIGDIALDLLLFATLASAVIVCATRRSQLVVGLTLAIVIQGAAWFRDFRGIEVLSVAISSLAMVFFGYVAWLVLADVFRSRTVSTDTICGALAVYLLLGVWWAFAYALLEALVPGSIVGLRIAGAAAYDHFLGYSFVTLTTLGYGNVVPGNTRADMLAVAEAVVGQIYLTVLIARLVALNLVAARTDANE